MEIYYVIALAVVVIMSAASFIVGRRTRPANAAKCSDLEAQLAESKEQLAKSEERLEALRSEAITLRSERDIERTSRQHLEEQVSTIKLEAKETLEAHTAALKESHDKQIAHLREEQQRQMDEFKALNKKQLDDQLELIREQMRTTSETVLKARQEELGERNVEQVSKIVDPLRRSDRKSVV